MSAGEALVIDIKRDLARHLRATCMRLKREHPDLLVEEAKLIMLTEAEEFLREKFIGWAMAVYGYTREQAMGRLPPTPVD